MSVAVLFAGVGSGPDNPSSATVAVLVTEVTPAGTGVFTRTITVRVTVAPTPTVPRFQVTTPGVLSVPPSEALTNVVLAGIVSVSVTPVAS